MRTIALIPARKASERFYAKLLQKLGERSVVWHTVYNAQKTGLFSQIILATDSSEIAESVSDLQVKIFKSKRIHASGSDRIAEAAENIHNADLFINIQADEPFLNSSDLAKLIDIFPKNPEISVASLMRPINEKEADNPNRVKVVVDTEDFALYFSRAKIPCIRDISTEQRQNYWQHIGIYAFRPDSLRAFPHLTVGRLEDCEKLECLRFLEHGIRVKMLRSQHNNLSIDTVEDLEIAQSLLANYQL